MKLTTAFCTLALATAAEQATAAKQQDDGSQSQGSQSQGSQSQGSQSQGAQSQDAQSQGSDQAEGDQGGYQQAESYGQEESYGAEAYSAPAVFMKPVENCFAGCPKHAPCMGAGGCQPKSCGGAEAHYAAPVQSYGAQQSYGGDAEQQGGDAEQQGGYRRLQYSEPQYAEHRTNCGCAAGSVDTSHLELQSNIILWVAFGLLFLPSLYFLCRAFEDFTDTTRTAAEIAELITLPRVIAGVVTLIASLAYLTMATGHGYIVKCNGRQFYYARYVDWAITTPLMLWDLITFGTASSAKTPGSVNLTRVFLVVMDVFMIVAGLIGELIEGGERWAFFGFSMLAFIPIMWFLCKLENDDGVCCGAAAGLSSESKLFQRILMITIITWSVYPVIWILATTGGSSASVGAPVAYAAAEGGYAAAEGGYRALAEGGFTAVGVISVDAECWIYTILDVIAKSVFGGVIVFWNWTEWCNCDKVVIAPNSML